MGSCAYGCDEAKWWTYLAKRTCTADGGYRAGLSVPSGPTLNHACIRYTGLGVLLYYISCTSVRNTASVLRPVTGLGASRVSDDKRQTKPNVRVTRHKLCVVVQCVIYYTSQARRRIGFHFFRTVAHNIIIAAVEKRISLRTNTVRLQRFTESVGTGICDGAHIVNCFKITSKKKVITIILCHLRQQINNLAKGRLYRYFDCNNHFNKYSIINVNCISIVFVSPIQNWNRKSHQYRLAK